MHAGSECSEFDSASLNTEIAMLRPDGLKPVRCNEYFDGGECRVYKAEFPDGDSWAIRIPLHTRATPREYIIAQVQHEVAILRELDEKGFAWSPKLRGYSLTFDSPVHFPFCALSWAPGKPLVWSADDPARPFRDKILGQLAQILLSLIQCTSQSGTRASEYYERLVNNKLTRVRNGQLPELTEKDCLDQATLLTQVLHPELENAPFVLEHGDMAAQNIIIDSEHNITGIIDWGFASRVPFQMACRLPRLLSLEPAVLPPSPTMQEDRRIFVDYLRSRAPQLATWISLAYSPDDLDFRNCFLESLVSKGMHRWFAEQKWELPTE